MLVQDPISGRAVNPRLVYALEVLKATFVPRVYTSHVVFQASAAGAELPSTLNERVPADTVIKSVEFSIRQPNLFAGNVLKPQRDAYFQANTYMEVEAETFGGPPSECVKITADGPMPLESFARGSGNVSQCFQGAFGNEFVLGENMNIRLLTRTLVALAGNEAPTEVFFTFKVHQIDSCCLKTISYDKAMEYMRSGARAAAAAGR